ncbi:hypothetical protein HMPREF9078_01684 [Capnocytophaga sp. oral taxon 380 str. F0488]|nr:hypothetical protein HMPREF9078_01684 [Capnocytophaga sp. oral taxon 380 str. F0488]
MQIFCFTFFLFFLFFFISKIYIIDNQTESKVLILYFSPSKISKD